MRREAWRGVANGTDALELSLAALRDRLGYEVIARAESFIATAEAVTAVGIKPASRVRHTARAHSRRTTARRRASMAGGTPHGLRAITGADDGEKRLAAACLVDQGRGWPR